MYSYNSVYNYRWKSSSGIWWATSTAREETVWDRCWACGSIPRRRIRRKQSEILATWDQVTSLWSEWPTELRPTSSWRYRCSNSASLGSWAMVFDSNNRWAPQDSRVDGAYPSNRFSQLEKPIFQMGSSFSGWLFEGKTSGGCPTASRRPAGTREMPFSRSNYKRWDMDLPWHEARDYLAAGWRRTTSPCQKDNCRRKAHADCFLGNSRDHTPLLASKR
jgi:hypothetical protein